MTNTIQTISPHQAHFLWVLLKCSILSHCLFRHAHSLPFAPSTKTIRKPTYGIKKRSDIQTLLETPQIQLNKNAPQFHPVISIGTWDRFPWPDVFSICPNKCPWLAGTLFLFGTPSGNGVPDLCDDSFIYSPSLKSGLPSRIPLFAYRYFAFTLRIINIYTGSLACI